MATTGEVPWSDAEKLVLLSEILKDAKIPPAHLLSIIKDAHIAPNWSEIPLPNGRSLNSCKNAFQTLLRSVSPAPASRRKPAASGHGHEPSSNGSPNPKKRPYTATEAPSTSRTIQPRPIAAALNGESPAPGEISSPFQTGAGEPPSDPNQPPKKKRGRPTKAETEAKRAAALARGEVYPPPKTPKTPRGSISGGQATAGEGASEPNAIVSAPMAVMTPSVGPTFSTPGTGGSGMDAPGTAGKRRRGRPTKAEAAAKRALLEAAAVAATGPEEEMDPKNDEDDPEDLEEPADFELEPEEPAEPAKPAPSAPEASLSVPVSEAPIPEATVPEAQPAEPAEDPEPESHNMELDQ